MSATSPLRLLRHRYYTDRTEIKRNRHIFVFSAFPLEGCYILFRACTHFQHLLLWPPVLDGGLGYPPYQNRFVCIVGLYNVLASPS